MSRYAESSLAWSPSAERCLAAMIASLSSRSRPISSCSAPRPASVAAPSPLRASRSPAAPPAAAAAAPASGWALLRPRAGEGSPRWLSARCSSRAPPPLLCGPWREPPPPCELDWEEGPAATAALKAAAEALSSPRRSSSSRCVKRANEGVKGWCTQGRSCILYTRKVQPLSLSSNGPGRGPGAEAVSAKTSQGSKPRKQAKEATRCRGSWPQRLQQQQERQPDCKGAAAAPWQPL
jgi:hypothetical protein